MTPDSTPPPAGHPVLARLPVHAGPVRLRALRAADIDDFGYAAFMAGIDALVMGRKTFEAVLAFDPWPNPGRLVHVMSRSGALHIPKALEPWVRQTRQAPADLLRQLAHSGVRRIYLDGGELTQAFLSDDLVDRMTITTVPLLLGEGCRPFGPLPAGRAWTLDGVRHWDGGLVQARYARQHHVAPGGAGLVQPG